MLGCIVLRDPHAVAWSLEYVFIYIYEIAIYLV